MSSSSSRWQRLEALFYQALELKPEERAAFLEKSCADDADLRKEIQELLNSSEKPMELLQESVVEAAQQMVAAERRRVIAPGTQLAQYTVISMLGAGGMGEVYLAEDTRLGRKVALKLLAPELTLNQRGLRRFEQEARAASALNHPNILTIYEFGEANGLHFIASEYVDGVTVRAKMAAGAIDLNIAVEIAIQIASALSAAHDGGIIHRDIKPDNVIVRNDGLVKVLDFGIAKLAERRLGQTTRRTGSTVTSSISEIGLVIGTAKYMSPEQARGVDIDARSDIFSLGSVMYEMVTGRCAFSGATTSDVIAEILKVEPPPPIEFAPETPVEIERIIEKALRKDRLTRYQSVRDLLIDLQDYKKNAEFEAKLAGQAGIARVKSDSGRKTPPRGIAVAAPPDRMSPAKKWMLAAVVAALIAVLGALTYLNSRKSSAVPTAAPTGTHPRSLAVLPFRNLREDPETDFLGFSLADEIITKLSYLNALTVRPSSSIDKYRNTTIDPQKVAADLNVDTLLTGSFLKDGDVLRITTQLIDVKPDKILWRDSIDVKYDKLLTVQDRVAQNIIQGLELNLSPTEVANLKPEKPINAQAYEYYLRGIDLYSQNKFAEAIDVLQKATAIEPNYAPAWAHLGRAYTTKASLHFGGQEDYEKAETYYQKALSLNPALVEPRIYMANLFTDTGRVEQAVPLLRSVLQDSPNNSEAHWELGYAYRFGGMLQESVAESEKARQNNPQVKINSATMNAYLYLGEYEKFLQSLPVNDFAYIIFYRGFAEYHLHDLQQAAEYFDRAYAIDPTMLPATVGKALSDSIKHDNAAGLKLLQQTENKIEERGVSDAEGLYKVAQVYAVLGDKSAALHMLRHSIGGGFFCYPYFERDPLLQSLRDQPDFQELMKQALKRHEQFKATFFGQ